MNAKQRRIEVGRTTVFQSEPITAPPKPEPQSGQVQVRVIPQINAVLSDAEAVLALEMDYYARKRMRDPEAPLTAQEAATFHGHIRALGQLQEQKARQEAREGLGALNDEQLLALMPEAAKALKGPAS